ncbi:hypothetical protein V1503_18875 [Bacillus sp. SCS-151]|uniref:hypothetical protein n=1 Tax=Nanhaiella sioensis TaxID=3115293 RepID=UPI003979A84F
MRDYSNYHNTDMNEKIAHDGNLILEHSLNGFEGYDATINNHDTAKVLIYEKYDSDSETKKVIGYTQHIERGNLLTIDGLHWLITSFPEDNKIYRKAEIRLCNATFPHEYNKTRVLLGYDRDGKPIYDDVVEYEHIPCIAETKYTSTFNNDQLPLPDGHIKLILQYRVSESITVNREFEMYKNTYKITDIDYTKVINDKGIMVILAERMV